MTPLSTKNKGGPQPIMVKGGPQPATHGKQSNVRTANVPAVPSHKWIRRPCKTGTPPRLEVAVLQDPGCLGEGRACRSAAKPAGSKGRFAASTASDCCGMLLLYFCGEPWST